MTRFLSRLLSRSSSRFPPSVSNRSPSRIAGSFCLSLVVVISGCGDGAPQPLTVGADNVTSLDPHVAFSLPANTRLEALNPCVISFSGTDLFEEGDVIGEVVVIDNDALIYLGPNNKEVAVTLERTQSMLITKPRTITVTESGAVPCRFKVTRPDGT